MASTSSFDTQVQHSLGRRLLGDRVGALGLGCMGMSEFYGRTDDTQSLRVIHSALDGGVNVLDTADMYGDGHNEELIGHALRTHREQAFVATKFGIRRDGKRRWNDASANYTRKACDASLHRLGVETIDLYYLHRLDKHTPIEDTIGAMAELVQAGKVRYIGLSEVSAQILRRAHAVHPITALQSEFSLWTRDMITDGVLTAARDLGTTLVAYSPLGRGMLTGQIAALDDLAADDIRRIMPRFVDSNLDSNLSLLDSLRTVADQHDVTPGQIALAWVLAQGEDVIPIPGTKRLDYLAQNIAAATISLSAQERNTLDDAFGPDNVHGARYPAATLPDTRSTLRGATSS